MTIHTDIQQGSEEWRIIRAGRIGGTSCAALLVNGKSDDGLGAGARSLIYRKAAEYITGPEEDSYTNAAMERGTALEPIARRRYEDEYFCTVQQVGYISEGEYLGVSPDGLIGDDGGLEIKCPGAEEFLRFLDTREMDNKYYMQVQWNLYVTGRIWWDFVYYHPEFAPTDLICERFHPDAYMFSKWDEKIPVYVAELERLLNKVAEQRAAV